MNVAVLKVELRSFKSCFRSLHLGLIHINSILLGVIILLRNGPGSDDLLVAGELDLGKIECRLRLRKCRLSRVDLCLVGTRVDHKQKLAFFEVLAVLKMPLNNAAADLRRYRHRLEGRVSTDFVQISRDVLRGRLNHCD